MSGWNLPAKPTSYWQHQGFDELSTLVIGNRAIEVAIYI
jgi:hypothetical protein